MLLGVFGCGIVLGLLQLVPATWDYENMATIILYILAIQIGLGLGLSGKLKTVLRTVSMRMLVLPFGTIAGTLLFTVPIGMLFSEYALTDWLAIGSGMGYYSLSSILILQLKSGALAAELGTLAVLTNIIREVLALFAIPFLVRYTSRYSAVAAAGVTSLDVSLPMLGRYGGADLIPVALLHGIVLEIAVPLLVTLFCTI